MVVIVMGVTGSGKSTVGARLAADLGWPFYDADSFHPPENVARMSRGIALTDADRHPWLQAIRARIDDVLARGESAVIGCSALKDAYRSMLGADKPGVRFVFLRGDQALLAERLRHRVGHFMNPRLLGSQLDTLEEPDSAVRIEIALPLSAQLRRIRSELAL
jgi:carbohydrate kinase (thermoresistant glucokinase family)